MLALVYEAILKRPSAALLAELRMNEERLGATVVDRQRARMVIEHAEDDDLPEGVSSLADRRAALRERLEATRATGPDPISDRERFGF
ncbi:hypothetical protein ACFYON_17450 [Micromonospora sp. NPDC005686]|uniref:phage terminase small subunit n=1 Tax=unclassified Micromonospora TaxID=2617518 RepID=UPI0033DAB65E